MQYFLTCNISKAINISSLPCIGWNSLDKFRIEKWNIFWEIWKSFWLKATFSTRDSHNICRQNMPHNDFINEGLLWILAYSKPNTETYTCLFFLHSAQWSKQVLMGPKISYFLEMDRANLNWSATIILLCQSQLHPETVMQSKLIFVKLTRMVTVIFGGINWPYLKVETIKIRANFNLPTKGQINP